MAEYKKSGFIEEEAKIVTRTVENCYEAEGCLYESAGF